MTTPISTDRTLAPGGRRHQGDHVITLSRQYAIAWVSDLDARTGGKLSKSATPTQMNLLHSAAHNASWAGKNIEDLKAPYADNFSTGFAGMAGKRNVDKIIRGLHTSTPQGFPDNAVGSLPPTAAGQSANLRSAVATDMGIQLGVNGDVDPVSASSAQDSPAPGSGMRAIPSDIDNTAYANPNIVQYEPVSERALDANADSSRIFGRSKDLLTDDFHKLWHKTPGFTPSAEYDPAFDHAQHNRLGDLGKIMYDADCGVGTDGGFTRELYGDSDYAVQRSGDSLDVQYWFTDPDGQMAAYEFNTDEYLTAEGRDLLSQALEAGEGISFNPQPLNPPTSDTAAQPHVSPFSHSMRDQLTHTVDNGAAVGDDAVPAAAAASPAADSGPEV